MSDHSTPEVPGPSDEPAGDERHLGLAAAVLALLAVAIVVALTLFPGLRHDPFEAATGAESPAVPDLPDPIVALNELLASISQRWRQGRFDAAFFDDLAARVEELGSDLPASPDLELVGDWAAGGQALAAGDRASARELLERVIRNPVFGDWIQLLPGRFVGRREATAETLDDWRLAVFWGDPLGDAGELLEARIDDRGPQRTLLLGRAVLSHLDGRHAQAAAEGSELAPDFGGPQTASLISRFVGDQFLWSGDLGTAISWYKKIDSSASRAEIAAVLHALRLEGGTRFLATACEGGFRPACEP